MKPVTKLTISDLHFGKALNIRKALSHLLSFDINGDEIDILNISGDFFEKLLSLDSKDALDGIGFGIELGKYCIKHNIKLRILKGTPYHDRNQLNMLMLVYDETMPKLDVRYYDKLSVDYDCGQTILYLPDEWKPTANETYLDIIKIMQENNIDIFDSIVMHGSFKHSLNMGDDAVKHDEQNFLNICKGFIVSGHIHKHMVYSRIITPGSFERLRFGDESPKGVVLTREYHNPENNIMTFIENKHATIYKTLFAKSTTMQDFMVEVLPIIKKYPEGSNFKIIFEDGNPLYFSSMDDFAKGYNVEFQLDVGGSEETSVEDDIDIFDDFELTLDKGSIERFIDKRLTDSSLKDDVLALLREGV